MAELLDNDLSSADSSDVPEGNENNANVAEELIQGRPKRGRKRKIPQQSRQDRKRLYNTNKDHVNSKGNITPEKIFDENFVCSCRKRCTNTVPLEERKRVFKQYWSMGTFAGRCVLLLNCVSTNEGYRTYSIFGKKVCKRGLLQTLQISEGRITVALKKMLQDTYADGRGQTSGGRNAYPPEKWQEVRNHINSFPRYVSHYTRNQTDSKFLNSNLNLLLIYRLYQATFENPVSKSFYKRIFYKEFNLRFKKPKKDTCKKCDLYKKKIENADPLLRHMLEEWHNSHLEQAEILSTQMNNDLELAQNDPEVETATYDMQKTLSSPRLPTSIVYYKRQLNLYNQGIHVGSINKGLFHLWLETEASKGTQEVGSCLKKFLESIAEPVKTLFLWSDSCGGQNRSIKLVLMLIYLLQHHPSLKIISLRFLETGHTFLPNDSEFGDFECALKWRHERVYTDKQYIEIMENCRTENKFKVIRMTPQDFFSVSEMEKCITNRKFDVQKEKINWLETHEILLDKAHPNIIKMKRKLEDDFQSVDLSKTGIETDFKAVELGQLWPNGRVLSKEKVKDLKEILELVPEKHKHFYSFLENVATDEFIDDVDGFGRELDFELELE